MNERVILKNNRISCFADEIDPSVEKQTALLSELGIGAIEFRSGDGKGVADYTIQEAEGLKKRLDAAGIRLSAVGSPIGKIGIEEEFSPHLKKLEHIIELSDVWETDLIRCFSFYLPEGADAAGYRDEVFRRTEQMVELAARHGKTLLHENEKGIYGDLAPRCLELMQRFYGDSYKAVFDFANFVQCGQDTLEAWELLKDYVFYIHVKDARMGSGEVVPAGSGDGHVKEILTALDERGFTGFLSLEPHLADFAGLQGLEKDAARRGRTDTEQAFVTAWQALCDLLTR